MALKGSCLIESMPLIGVVVDAHPIVIISHMLEMIGLGIEMMEL